ncbi:OadG family protein [Maioricimonas sp. JC845]|uniref:OadG family protein n=1 Tax=Maioricimonas sp. JC845 TaxID=3232138 RepID=UPI003459386E
MAFITIDPQNVVDSNGVALALTGMLIVFSALVLISLFIACVPHLLGLLNRIFPEVEHHHTPPRPADQPDLELVAAIGLALHRQGRGKP